MHLHAPLLCVPLLAAIFVSASGAIAQTTIEYENDFSTAVDAPGGTWSVTGAAPLVRRDQSLGVQRDDPSFFDADDTFWSHTASLSLDPLGGYSSGSIFFRMIVWPSWDYSSTTWGPDWFYFNINGQPPAVATTFSDGLVEFHVPFTAALAGVAPTFNFVAAATQADEGLTIDEVRVEITRVPTSTVTPEPVSVILLGSGLLGIAAAARRRRRTGE